MKSIKNSEAMLKSHIHIVTVLTMLTAGADNADTDELLTLKQAMALPHQPEFKKAMQTEYDSLVHNNTWELVLTLTNQRVLTERWVFKIKKDRFGNILKFKARWVAHGYKQEKGLNFTDTFASVIKPMFWKVIMAVTAKWGLKIWQMNVMTVYLFEFLNKKVYIRQLTLRKDSTMRVCLLKKALYSLKQSARVWYQSLQNFLKKLEFKHVNADHGLFVSNDRFIYIAIYVDDILFFSALNNPRVQEAMQELQDRFQMTDLSEVSHYLSMEVNNNIEKKTITLRQFTYLKKVIGRYSMKDVTPLKIPMSPGVPNSLNPNPNQASKETITWYQSAVSALMWSAVHFRPDLAQSVAVLTRFCSNLSPIHVTLIKQMFWYVADTINKGLVFRENNIFNDMKGYTDSDFTDVKASCKLTDSYIFKLAGAAISHSLKLQIIVTLFTCKAEYIVMCEVGKEAV